MPLTKAEISRLRSLQEKKTRETAGAYVVEGTKVVAELLSAGAPIAELYVREDWTGPRDDPRVRVVSAAEMQRISHFPTPSPVLAVGQIERKALTPGELNRGLTLALDGVQDAGNVGTLLRVADWFGLDRVLLSPDCADLFSQKVINASMGSFSRVRTITLPLEAALTGLAVPVLGCDLGGDDVHTLPVLRDAVMVIGSEGRGLTEAVRTRVTRLITIPKIGGAESLNAGVAAAIVCDNLRRIQGRG